MNDDAADEGPHELTCWAAVDEKPPTPAARVAPTAAPAWTVTRCSARRSATAWTTTARRAGACDQWDDDDEATDGLRPMHRSVLRGSRARCVVPAARGLSTVAMPPEARECIERIALGIFTDMVKAGPR